MFFAYAFDSYRGVQETRGGTSRDGEEEYNERQDLDRRGEESPSSRAQGARRGGGTREREPKSAEEQAQGDGEQAADRRQEHHRSHEWAGAKAAREAGVDSRGEEARARNSEAARRAGEEHSGHKRELQQSAARAWLQDKEVEEVLCQVSVTQAGDQRPGGGQLEGETGARAGADRAAEGPQVENADHWEFRAQGREGEADQSILLRHGRRGLEDEDDHQRKVGYFFLFTVYSVYAMNFIWNQILFFSLCCLLVHEMNMNSKWPKDLCQPMDSTELWLILLAMHRIH